MKIKRWGKAILSRGGNQERESGPFSGAQKKREREKGEQPR